MLFRSQLLPKQVIFVETDKVAMHVMRHNHDTTYNKALSDSGIEHHVEYPSFESVFQDIDSFMEQHGRKCRTPKLIFHWSMLLVLNYHCF